MRVVLVAVVAAACGGKAAEVPPVCTHIAKVCGETYTKADIEKCAADWPGFQKEFGPDITGTFVACTNDAKTCTEARQCSRTAVSALRDAKAQPSSDGREAPGAPLTDPRAQQREWAERQMRERMDEARRQMEAGRGLAEQMKNDPFFHDTEPLPPECARADELCPKDEPFARRLCRDMVRDLRGDDAHLAELTKCQDEAKSCAAFRKCRDDIWFAIH